MVVFGDGIGNPYFSADTTAVLRAKEIGAYMVVNSTTVDRFFNKNPILFRIAKKFDHLIYIDTPDHRLAVIGGMAASLCTEKKRPILAFILWVLE